MMRGRVDQNAILGGKTWFHTGGTADTLFRPADSADLQEFLQTLPATTPITPMGVGSNVIIRDGGVRGITLRFGQGFAQVNWLDDLHAEIGAGALDFNVAAQAQKRGVGGLAFLSGIPGSIGGAIKMNAGAYNGDMSHIVQSVKIMRRDGTIENWDLPRLNFSYRHSAIPDDAIILSCIARGTPSTPDAEQAAIDTIRDKRHATQPVRAKTGGSTFANPTPAELQAANIAEPLRAWQLIDAVGGRTLQIGGAHMSPIHCNFMINDGTASATDLENLGDTLIKRIYEQFGIRLHWEIKRIGQRTHADT